MTVYQWLNASSGDWKTGANWNVGTAPNDTSANVTIETNGSYTVTIAAAESFVADNLTLDAFSAMLQVAGTLDTTTGVLVHFGTLEVSGKVAGPITVDGDGVLLQSGTGPFTLSSQLLLDGGVVTFLNTSTGTADVSVASGELFQAQGMIVDATSYQPAPADPPVAKPTVLTNHGTMEATSPTGSTTIDSLAIAVSTFDNFGVVTTAGNELLVEAGTFDNAAGATLAATGTATVVIESNFANAGLISVDGGSLLLFTEQSWTNTGTIRINNAALSIGGDESLADLGSISVAGASSVTLDGTLENAGHTLNAASPAVLHGMVLDGLIKGGTLDASALGLVVGFDGSLDNVTVIDGLTLASGNLTLLDGSQVYSDAAAHTLATIEVEAGASLTISKTVPYTIGESIAGTDANVQLFGSFTLTGTVSDPGGTVALGTYGGLDSWINHGVVSVSNGQLDLDGNETVADLGSLELSNSLLIYASGTLDNTGGTLGAANTELHGITLEGITVLGGTMDATGLGVKFGPPIPVRGGFGGGIVVPNYLAPDLNLPNTLDNVTVINGLTLAVGDVVLTDGSAVYTDATAHTLATIDVTGNPAVSTGTIGFDGTAGYTIDQPLLVNGGVAMLDGGFVLKSTINQTGGTLVLAGDTGDAPPSWTNDSTITATGALVQLFGNETVAKIGDLVLSGSTLEYIGGTLDNTGHTLNAADTSLLGVTLDGGTVEGGTIDPGALGLHFGRFTNHPSVLDNVTVLNNLTVDGTAALSGTTTVFSAGSASPPGTITIANFGRLDYVGAGPTTLENNISLADGQLGWIANFGTVAETVDVTVAADVAIAGEGSISDDGFYQTTTTLTNAGTIGALNGELQINIDGFDNKGLLQAGTDATLAVVQFETAVVWSNSGTISGNDAAEIVLGGALHNTGLITVNGGSLIIGSSYQTYDQATQLYSNVYPTWTNTGTIDATNATLLFEGDETAGDFGTINRSNSPLYYVGGTLANTGVTLDGSQTSLAGLQLAGGTIEGGVILAAPLGFGVGGLNYSNVASDLDNVIVIGGFGIDGQVNVTGTTAFYADASRTTPAAVTIYNAGVLAFAQTGPQTLNNNVALVGGTLTWSLIQNLYFGTKTDVASIASGVAVTGYGSIADNRSGVIDSLTNDGTVIADFNFENLTIGVATFDNQGLLEGTNSATLTIGASRYVASAGTTEFPTFINNGTIEANHGSVVLAGDETVADLGLIENIAGSLYYGGGTLENTGGTLNGADTSILNLQMAGGEIEGGTLDQTPLGLGFVPGYINTLDNVAIINNLTLSGTVMLTGSSAIYADASATTPGTATVSDGFLEFVGAGPFTLTNDVTLGGDLGWSSPASVSAVSTVTIAAGVLVAGSGQVADSTYFGQGGTDALTNLGTIEATGFDGNLFVTVATFTNRGTLIAGNAASFTVNSPHFTNLNNGTLTGGTFVANSEASFNFDDGDFQPTTTITVDAADLVLTGNAAFMSLESTLTSVAAAGTIEVDNGAGFGGTNTLSVAGTILLGGGTLSETSIELHAGGALSGYGQVFAPSGLKLDRSITASGGTLDLNAPVTGTGTVDVATASTVQFDGSSANAVDLTGADATVVLGAGVAYSGTIHGFAAGDMLVIDGFEGTQASYLDNHVVVNNSSASVTVDLVGNFATDAFSATIPVPGDTTVQLVQGPTLSVSAPASTLDQPGSLIVISGVSLTDGSGATATVDISALHGVLAASAEDGGIVQGNGTGSLVLSGTLGAVNAELATLQYRAPGAGPLTDTIVVNATDDTSGMATGLITITIDQPPTIALPAAAFEPVGTVAPITGLGLTKPDPFSGETITVTLTDSAGLLAATTSGSGTVTGSGSTMLVLTGSLADVNTEMGSVTFDGSVNDQVTISADDGRGGLREAILPVFVNLPPAITAPGTAAAILGATVPVTGVSIADPYGVAAGDLFTVTLSDTTGTLTTTAVAGASVSGSDTGTLTLVGTLSSINTELAALDYGTAGAASDKLVIGVSDGQGETADATIDMAVAADVPPTTHVPATAVVTALTASPLGTITITDSDAIATSKIFTVVITDTTGTLSVPGTGIPGNMSDQLTLTGDLAAIDSKLASLQYTGAVPGQAANATATDTVTLLTQDGDGGSNTQEIAVTIDQVPYAPPGVSAPGGVALTAGLATTLGTIEVTDPFAQVTGATLDVSVSDLTGTLNATASGGGGIIGNGSSQLLITGSLAEVNAELSSLTYTGAPPNTALDETAADTVLIQAQDGRGGASPQQQIAVTVSPSGTQPYDAFLNAVDTLTTVAQENPNTGPVLTGAALAVYVASVSGAIGSVGGTVWQGAYDASSRAAMTVGADLTNAPSPAQVLSDSLGLLDTVVAGALGAIAANAGQTAYAAVEAAALALTADVSAGSNTKILTDLSTLYGAIAVAAGGTLSQAQWQTALSGSTSAANTLATAVSEGATNGTLLADAAALYDSVIAGSLTAIGGASLGHAYSTGTATLATLASDITGGAATQQILGDLGTIYNVVITGSVGAGIAATGVVANGISTVSATALSNYSVAIGASSGLLTTIAGNGSATEIYNSTRSVFIGTLPSALGSLNGPGVQSGLDIVTTLETALSNYVAAKPPSSQLANATAVGTSFLTSIFGAPGNADWTQYTDTVNQAASTDGPAISGQTAQAASAESDFLDQVLTSIFTLAEAQSPQAATAIDAALNTTVADENAGNGAAIIADVGKLFSTLASAAATGSSSSNAEFSTAGTVVTSGTGNADIDAFINANLPSLTGVAIDFGVPVAVLFIPSLAGAVPFAALLGAALLAYGIVDFGIRVLPPGNPYRGTWNNLKRNPIYTITHPWGGGHGDTHLTTYDGLYYNFQAAGEYVLSKSTQPGDSFQVQIRLQPWFNGASVSVITQAAVAVGSADKLTFDASRSDPVYFDGHPLTLTTGVVDNLGAASVEQLTGGSWQVHYATGESVAISSYGGYLNVDTALAGNTPAGSVEGLLGNDDGNPQNDLQANGTVLEQPLSSAQLYTTFANAWQVSDPGSSTGFASLLDYGASQSPATFTDPNFPSDSISLSSLPASVLENAASLVAAAGITDPAAAQGAIEDYLLTGDTSFIAADAASQNVEQPTVTAVVTPGTTSVALGIGVVSPVATLATTGTVTPVQFTVYLTGAEATAETVDYAVLAPGSADLGASAFAGAVLPTGTATIAAGQVSTTIAVAVLNTALGALPSATLEVGIIATDTTPVVAPDASVAIVNSQPVPGLPAIPAFLDVSNVGTLTNSGSIWSLDLGSYFRDTVFTDVIVDIANAASGTADLLSGLLTSGAGGAISFSSELGALRGLQPGAVDPLTVEFDTTQLGTYDTSLVLAANQSNASGYSASLGNVTLDVTGEAVACFLLGTRILTDRGEVAVEALRAGDLVTTLSGRGPVLKPIRWIGTSPVDLDRHPTPARAAPIRIMKDAFAPGVPHRDLLVSPDHSIAVGEALIPAYLLVNGASIRREPATGAITYFHVELDRHDILLAEGLAAESYLDTGNRAVFANAGVVRDLHPEFATRAVLELHVHAGWQHHWGAADAASRSRASALRVASDRP